MGQIPGLVLPVSLTLHEFTALTNLENYNGAYFQIMQTLQVCILTHSLLPSKVHPTILM